MPAEACGCKPAWQVPRRQWSVDGGLCLRLSGMATLKLLNMRTESSVKDYLDQDFLARSGGPLE